jgi:hypothetical protein
MMYDERVNWDRFFCEKFMKRGFAALKRAKELANNLSYFDLFTARLPCEIRKPFHRGCALWLISI